MVLETSGGGTSNLDGGAKSGGVGTDDDDGVGSKKLKSCTVGESGVVPGVTLGKPVLPPNGLLTLLALGSFFGLRTFRTL